MSTSVKTEIFLLNPRYHRNFGEIQTPKPRKLQISTASIPGLKYQAVLLCSSTQQPKFEISSYYLHHMKDCSVEGKKHSQQSGLILRTQIFHLLIILFLNQPNRNYCQISQIQSKTRNSCTHFSTKDNTINIKDKLHWLYSSVQILGLAYAGELRNLESQI